MCLLKQALTQSICAPSSKKKGSHRVHINAVDPDLGRALGSDLMSLVSCSGSRQVSGASGESAAWPDLSGQHALTNDASLAGATAWGSNIDLMGNSILPARKETICNTVACSRLKRPGCCH